MLQTGLDGAQTIFLDSVNNKKKEDWASTE